MEEIKKKYEVIAGEWNGEDKEGEERAMNARDIVDLIEEIEREEKEITRLQDELQKDKEKLATLIENN